jgi:hypothetical protein
MFFGSNSKNSVWFTSAKTKNTEFLIGFFLFIILFFFLEPSLLLNFSTALGLVLF